MSSLKTLTMVGRPVCSCSFFSKRFKVIHVKQTIVDVKILITIIINIIIIIIIIIIRADLHGGICANPQKGAQCMNRMIDLSD